MEVQVLTKALPKLFTATQAVRAWVQPGKHRWVISGECAGQAIEYSFLSVKRPEGWQHLARRVDHGVLASEYGHEAFAYADGFEAVISPWEPQGGPTGTKRNGLDSMRVGVSTDGGIAFGVRWYRFGKDPVDSRVTQRQWNETSFRGLADELEWATIPR